ncbi:MAG TPA: response regulator [Kofleriaceae bacterium]|jgi:two-component system response regulator|nr:response regulator [Kofleriaceae bacterium]
MNNTMLLVEDNPTDEKLTLRAFRTRSTAVNIVVVRDGVEALDYLFGTGAYAGRDTSSQPGLILLDVKLPRVDGLEVLVRIRADERTRAVPVVILTASLEEQDVVRSYLLGVNAYVRKPVDFAEFVKTAETIGHFWLTLNEAPPRPRTTS